MPGAAALFSRALRLRCPACGGGPVVAGWFNLRERCPGCGLSLEREEGYFLGAMLLNAVVTELLAIAAFAIVLIRTWPTPPWTLATYALVIAMVLVPVATWPFSKTLWLAFDLLVQPVRPEESRRHHPSDGPPPPSS